MGRPVGKEGSLFVHTANRESTGRVAPVTLVKLNALGAPVVVVTVQVHDVVLPAVTFAVVAVPVLDDEVRLMAIVSPD
jgi:hypothetical protein